MKSDILQTPSESESISDLLSLGSIEIIEIGHEKRAEGEFFESCLGLLERFLAGRVWKFVA
jgi:hypothetical protein